jgi:hypothetical protein
MSIDDGALHERASSTIVISTEDDHVAEAILRLIFQDRIDEIVTVLTTEASEHTFMVTSCCDANCQRTVQGWDLSSAIGDDSVAGMVEIPLSDVAGLHVW